MTKGTRERLLLPILIPILALALIGAVLFLFSRILLDISPEAATATALLTAAAVLAIGGYVSGRDKLTMGSLWSMAGAVLGVGMLIGGVAILVGQPSEEGEEVPFVAVITAPPGADGTGFNVQTLTGPADEPFVVELQNEDSAQHNFTVRETEDGPDLAVGPNIGGPGLSANTQVPALAPGDYFFLCTLHPTTMKGTLSLTIGGGPVVVAKETQFDTDVIELPPDLESPLTLDNQDAGTAHNIAIYTDDTLSVTLFQGAQFPGIAIETYAVPALAPGEYYFRCDVHPPMEGTVVVGAPEGEPPPAEEEPPPEA